MNVDVIVKTEGTIGVKVGRRTVDWRWLTQAKPIDDRLSWNSLGIPSSYPDAWNSALCSILLLGFLSSKCSALCRRIWSIKRFLLSIGQFSFSTLTICYSYLVYYIFIVIFTIHVHTYTAYFKQVSFVTKFISFMLII